MARRPIPIRVTARDRVQLQKKLLRGGVAQVRVVPRALALRRLDGGAAAPQAAQDLPLTPEAIRDITHRQNNLGLDAALFEKPRRGAKSAPDKSQK